MATQVQVSDDGGSTWRDIDYGDFAITLGTSETVVAPSATITTLPDPVGETAQNISANQPLRILINGVNRFEGLTESPGTIDSGGTKQVEVKHRAAALFGQEASVDLTGGTDSETVLETATDDTPDGTTWTINHNPATVSMDEYVVDNRPLKRVFRDVMDRTGFVWFVDPSNKKITVNVPGGGGLWKSLSGSGDGITVRKFDAGRVDSVRNRVTVTATRGTGITGTAEDQTSIDTYGERPLDINVAYADTQAEADAIASELLQPDPLAEGEVVVPQTVGGIEQSLVNQTIDITVDSKGIDESSLVVEKQVIEQGRATLAAGQGTGVQLSNVNRLSKSREDETNSGFLTGNSDLADDSVDTPQLVDTAVIEDKLADLSVALEKVQDDAIDTVKITDNAIETPKIAAEAVTASEILADTITANEITADTITALEIAADTLTASEIDVLDLDAGELSVTGEGLSIEFNVDPGGEIEPDQMAIYPVDASGVESTLGLNDSANEWAFAFIRNVRPQADDTGEIGSATQAYSDVHAYEFIDASTGSAINDGGDPLAGLSDGDPIPDHVRRTDDDGEEIGVSVNELSKTLWDICSAQQDRIDELEERLSVLEQQV